MIHTAQQLKGLVRNLSKGDSAKAQTLMRSYATERFLERLSLSPYRENLVLKGGVLVAAMVGLDSRSTMDIDTTLKNLTLREEDVRRIVETVADVSLEDNMTFTVKSVQTIMDENDYPGIRVLMEAILERAHIPMKIDFSTGDAITPREITFPMKLLFEDRSISVLSYNIETLLAEKMETAISRGTANTRMRDFYDMYLLASMHAGSIDHETLHEAFCQYVRTARHQP